jgi:hypothetical protein
MSAGTPIPTHTLILCEDLGPRLGAARVGEALAAGLIETGARQPDVCALEGTPASGDDVRELLDGVSFDARMRAARAVILAVAALEEGTLPASLAFEAATRARQGGVPCYAVTAANRLDAFDMRILDLQAVLEAGTPRALRSAGRRLATIL